MSAPISTETTTPAAAPVAGYDLATPPDSSASSTSIADATPKPASPPPSSSATVGNTPPPQASKHEMTALEPVLSTRPPATAPAELQEAQLSPEVASLKAIFPDFDPVILQSVLESVDGNQDRAIDMLLGMSDPDYVQQQPLARTQTELDEDLARRLMQEEEMDQQHHAGNWGPQYPQQPQRGGYAAYQRRQHGPSPPGSGQQQQQAPGLWGGGPGGGERDTMTEVQEQFKQIAETGKKTFSSLVTKVKAKMQEFDQSRVSNQGSSGQSNWGGGPVGGQRPPTNQPSQVQSYYDPNYPDHDPIPPAPVQGYDVPQSTTAPTRRPADTPPAPEPTAAPPGDASSGVRAASPTGASIPRPPSTGGGAPNIDMSKLGLLPKRPVSLLAASPHNSRPSDEDEDELDYVENPFEDGRR